MNRNSLFWGLAFVLFGCLLLLNNLGIFYINVWKIFWPMLVILVGVWVLWQSYYGGESLETETISIPLDGAAEARISMHHGAGELRVAGGASADEILSGSFTGGIKQEVVQNGDRLDLTLKVPSDGFPFVFAPIVWGKGDRIRWDVQLNQQVPIFLEVNSGASDAQLDFQETQIKELVIKTGASSTSIVTPAQAGFTRLKIEAGAASVKIRVPENVAASLKVDGGLLGVDVDQDRFPKTGKLYQSPDYDTAPNKLEIKVDAGAGSISVS
jgi:hypothetical protein